MSIMKQKYNKTLYSNQLSKTELEKVLCYLKKSKANLKQTNDFFKQYELITTVLQSTIIIKL